MSGSLLTSRQFTAVRIVEAGGPPTVDTVTLAPPGPDQVTVHLRYAAVNPLDNRVRATTALSPNGLPRTLGVEGVGEVDGQWYVLSGDGLGVARDGTWAEYTTVSRDELVPVPAGLDLQLATCAGMAGSTAVRVTCDLGRVDRGDRVLVLGAAGGTGSAIASLARSRGARVWGQVGSPAKADAVQRAGAVPIVAGTAAALRGQIGDLGITVAFDPLGGDYTAALVEAVTDGGRLISYGVSAGGRAALSMRSLYRRNLTIHGYGVLADPAWRVRAATGTALYYLATGRMTIPIDRVLPLAEAERALAALANREIIGKVLLDVRG
jgi:NADPH2:quinone reductase